MVSLSDENTKKMLIGSAIVLVVVILIIIFVCIHNKKKKESFDLMSDKMKLSKVAKADTPSYKSQEEKISDMLGNNIVPNNDIKIYTNMAQQLEVNQNDFINDAQNSDSAKQYQLSNWATRSQQLAAIKEQGLATKGPNNLQDSKELQAISGYKWTNNVVPDAYEKYANGVKNSAPVFDPSIIAYGQQISYEDIGNEVSRNALRKQQKLNSIAGRYNSVQVQ